MARKSSGRRDPGSRGAPKNCRDHGNASGLRKTKLPCGGSKFVFTGHSRQPPRARHHHLPRRYHPISDKRHFAGVKAARTRTINEAVRRIKEARRTHLPQSVVEHEGRGDVDCYSSPAETYENLFLHDVRAILEGIL